MNTAIWDRISVIIVVHNSGAVIGACLDVFPAHARMIVIDNASADNTLAIVREKAPQAYIIENKIGVGYGNAASQGLASVETEFALMMNPDAVFEPSTMEKLVALMDEDAHAGMVSPILPLPDGGYDKAWDGPFERRAFMASKRDGEPRPEGRFCTWYVSGAVILLRMAAARKAGFFDPAIFLYYEDDDLCMRLMKAGYTIQIEPAAEALHSVGGSVGTSWQAFYEKYYHLAWSRLYFETKYVSFASALKLGIRNALRFGPKAVLYALSLNRKKATRDAARFSGALAYLLGVPASKTTRRARPKKIEKP